MILNRTIRIATAGLLALGLASLGCDDEQATSDKSGVNISGTQGGGSAATGAPQAKLGEWIDVGDGVKVAVLGWQKAAETGGIMLKDDDRAVAVKLQIVNTSDKPVNFSRKAFKLLAGDEQHGFGMGSAAAGAAFSDESLDIQIMPSVSKLLPGQRLHGWQTFAPKDSLVNDDMSILLASSGNPMRSLKSEEITARIPLGSAARRENLSVDVSLKPNRETGETVTGGATDVTVNFLKKEENPKRVEEGHFIYVADLTLKNPTDTARKVNSLVGVAVAAYMVDGQGSIYGPTSVGVALNLPSESEDPMAALKMMAQLATWPAELQPGESADGKVAFEIPAEAKDLMFVFDTALGYSMTRESQQSLEAPVGVWKVGS